MACVGPHGALGSGFAGSKLRGYLHMYNKMVERRHSPKKMGSAGFRWGLKALLLPGLRAQGSGLWVSSAWCFKLDLHNTG